MSSKLYGLSILEAPTGRAGLCLCLKNFLKTPTSAAVDLSSYILMDPHLLVGLVNTELRNHCRSLDDLVKTHHLSERNLVDKLAAADYIYQTEQNQFR